MLSTSAFSSLALNHENGFSWQPHDCKLKQGTQLEGISQLSSGHLNSPKWILDLCWHEIRHFHSWRLDPVFGKLRVCRSLFWRDADLELPRLALCLSWTNQGSENRVELLFPSNVYPSNVYQLISHWFEELCSTQSCPQMQGAPLKWSKLPFLKDVRAWLATTQWGCIKGYGRWLSIGQWQGSPKACASVKPDFVGT